MIPDRHSEIQEGMMDKGRNKCVIIQRDTDYEKQT